MKKTAFVLLLLLAISLVLAIQAGPASAQADHLPDLQAPPGLQAPETPSHAYLPIIQRANLGLPTTGQFAFQSKRDGNWEIFTMNADGSDQTQVTQTDKNDDGDQVTNENPSWKPDGSWIAFDANLYGNFDIYKIKNEGGTPEVLTIKSKADDAYPAWSPLNTQILFASNRDGDWEIFVMNQDGSAVTQLTKNSNTDDKYPAWSPDGKQIVFSSNYDNPASDIWVMDADGKNPRQLTDNSSEEYDPVWSPDGQRIAYTYCSYSGGIENCEIVVMNSDGKNAFNLSNNPAKDTAPTWSPDSKMIAFASNRAAIPFGDNFTRIYIQTVGWPGIVELTHNNKSDNSPDWLP